MIFGNSNSRENDPNSNSRENDPSVSKEGEQCIYKSKKRAK